jgi:hypothetical protein
MQKTTRPCSRNLSRARYFFLALAISVPRVRAPPLLGMTACKASAVSHRAGQAPEPRAIPYSSRQHQTWKIPKISGTKREGKQMRRILVTLTASLAGAAGLLLALPTGSASAAGPTTAAGPTIVSCKSFTGSTAAGSVAVAKGCNHRWISGGSATQTAGTGTFVVTWKTGKTTTGRDTTTVITPSACPAAFPEEIEAFGTVTGGTAKRLIGGNATSLFCANASQFELLPGTTWNM